MIPQLMIQIWDNDLIGDDFLGKSFGLKDLNTFSRDSMCITVRLFSVTYLKWFLIECRKQFLAICSFRFILVPRAHDPSAGRDRELWPVPKYAQSQWRCIFVTVGNHYCFKLLSLRRRAVSPWFTDFLVWNQPELSIPAAGQKDRGLWGRECFRLWLVCIMRAQLLINWSKTKSIVTYHAFDNCYSYFN